MEFKTYHPIVNLAYFVFVIGFSCFFMHPVCLGISLACAFVHLALIKGGLALGKRLLCIIPIVLAMALINPLFNHRGATILAYLPGGNPLTLQSVVYGVCGATMIASVICHFSCFNEIMTTDKIVCLFGRISPALSLVMAMTLRFVPEFSARIRRVADAQKCLGRGVDRGSIVKRAKNGLAILSIMITWSFENAIETADSMKARGYGLPGRSFFSVFTFDKRDKMTLIFILVLGIYVLFGSPAMSFEFYPYLRWPEVSAFGMTVFGAYFLLCICPLIIEAQEVIKWKATKSGI